MTDHIPEIAQRLFQENDNNGNLYKVGRLSNIWYYEMKVQELLDKITDIRRDNGEVRTNQ